ncbi:hypothetical protein CLCR_09309 [Cladophialophora carrionii]|uniref:Uncharacterized protein n=1 Tax=Cladophialophora carrionii TaxID=86049 RepID=A0A1C1CTC8_9EURO|nr:hypothetical protein CLCR_09309 [Cladophialophora carrionii]
MSVSFWPRGAEHEPQATKAARTNIFQQDPKSSDGSGLLYAVSDNDGKEICRGWCLCLLSCRLRHSLLPERGRESSGRNTLTEHFPVANEAGVEVAKEGKWRLVSAYSPRT